MLAETYTVDFKEAFFLLLTMLCIECESLLSTFQSRNDYGDYYW